MIQEPTNSASSESSCHGQKVSWLKLEKYHVGELQDKDRQDVAAHLSECALCNQKYQQITTDDRPLRRLEIDAVSEPASGFGFVFIWSLGACVAVAALLFIGLRSDPAVPITYPGSRISYKGGDTVLTVARERDGHVIYDPQTYRDGDRIRLFLTSPEFGPFSIEVVVFQDSEVHFPYPDRLNIPSGNRVPIAGALRLTGKKNTRVCVLLGPDLPSRELIIDLDPQAVSQNTVCYQLDAEDGSE